MLRSSPGSRPEVGSSRKSSDGLVRSSIATLTRLRWPPESFETGRLRRSRELELAEHVLDARVPLLGGHVGRETELGGVVQRLLDRELGVDDVVLRDEADPLAELVVVRRRGRGRRSRRCRAAPA